jgi:hypothetical protein
MTSPQRIAQIEQSRFFIYDGSTVNRLVWLRGHPIGEGAAGTIHRVVGEKGVVAKLYKEPKELPEYHKKITGMMAAPPRLAPISFNGRTCVQIAWPMAQVLDKQGGFCGFLMPEVDFQASTELENILQRSARQRKQLPEFYGFRVQLAANLAALMAELHALRHYMVDMKPMNMRFYPSTWYMAILDTDGFSINGTPRLPARQFSDEYIAPEAQRKLPEQLGLDQDLFALAVIIFRLLNNGIHPYQGMGRDTDPTTLQERIFAGLYAYGLTPHRGVQPTPSSIHEYLEDATRGLLDRAFQANGLRPTAEDWFNHLGELIRHKTLVRCAVNRPDHAHFSKGCGLCALEKRRTAAQMGARQLSPHALKALHTATAGSSRTLFGATPQSVLAQSLSHVPRNLLSRVVAIGVVLLCLWALIPGAQRAPTVPASTAPSSSAPAVVNEAPLEAKSAPPAGPTATPTQTVDAVRQAILGDWWRVDERGQPETLRLRPDGTYARKGVSVGHEGTYQLRSSTTLDWDGSIVGLTTFPDADRLQFEYDRGIESWNRPIIEYDGKQRANLQYNELSIAVDSEPSADGSARVAVATGSYQGHPVFSLRTDPTGRDDPRATVRVMTLDPTTDVPQVILTYFTGGAHCCIATQIATADSARNWHVVEAEKLDGEGYGFRDADGDGVYELVSVDNSFLYAFASYASSYAPTRIQKLVGIQLRDVTHEARYQGFLREELQEMETRHSNGGSFEPNGYLGPWVAAKALVGEFASAWQTMLISYDRSSTWLMEECLTGHTTLNCPSNKTLRMSFPEALMKLLAKRGYISVVQTKLAATQLKTPDASIGADRGPGSSSTPPVKDCFMFNGRQVCD